MRRIAMQLTLAFSNFPVLHNRRQAINSTPKHAPRLSAFWHASSRKPSRQPNNRRRPMNDVTKVGVSHLARAAYVYLRQSSPAQVEHNRESTQRQYALVSKATALGWPSQQVVVIDEDLGVSGSGIVERNGFARLTAEVALRHVGIVLGLEVSRLARNNADWYRLLDLCGLTDTLIGDADGLYHPALFNDRLLLGLKGNTGDFRARGCGPLGQRDGWWIGPD